MRPGPRAHRPGCGHIDLLLAGHHLGPHKPREPRPPGEGDCDDHVDHAGPQGRSDRHREDQPGNREFEVRKTHQDVVDPAAGIARHRADQDAGGGPQRHDSEAGEQGHPRAAQHQRENILPELVGAERMGQRRRPKSCGRVEPAGDMLGIGGKRGAEDSDDQQQRDQCEADQRKPALAEAVVGAPKRDAARAFQGRRGSRAHESRTLGLTSPCSTSTTRFAATNRAPITSVTPITGMKSCVTTAFVA